MTTIAAAGDAIRVRLTDVTRLDADSVAQPVTTGLTGTVSLENWDDEDDIALVATAIVLHSNDDWYLDITAPGAGHYRVVAVISVSGGQRTLHGELKVQEPPT